LEYERTEDRLRPHTILITVQDCNGRDGSILLGELTQIITAMRSRAIQPREELLPRQLEFEKEERFPVVMILLSLAYLGVIQLGFNDLPLWSPTWTAFIWLYGWWKFGN
jgi:hypothetical protein